MLKEDVEIEVMPAGCATTFPRRYEKGKVSKIPAYPNSLYGSGRRKQGSWDVSIGFWDEDLNKLLYVHRIDESRGTKRKINASFIPEAGSEAFEDKKKKYYDNHLPLNQESRVFRNRLFNDYIGEHSMNAPSGRKRNLKRKAENTQPNSANDFMDINGKVHSDTKILSKKRHAKKTRQVDMEDEPGCNIRKSETCSVDELMLELENVHIGPNPENQNVPVKETNAPTLKRKINVSNQGEAIPKTPKFKKLADWTKNHWEEDQNDAMLDGDLNSSVVVRSLPMTISTTYQQCLREVFEKYGQIIYIGPAIKHTTVNGKCTFNATIYFDSETAAIKALQEDYTRFGSSEIRVLRNLYSDTEMLNPYVTVGGKPGSTRLGIDKGTETTRPGRPSTCTGTPESDERKITGGKPCGVCCAKGLGKSTATTRTPSTDAETPAVKRVTIGVKSSSACRASGMVASLRLHPLMWLRHVEKTETTRLTSPATDTETPADMSVTADAKAVESRANDTSTAYEFASATRPGLAWDCQRQR